LRRDRNPNRHCNWVLVCALCKTRFKDSKTVGEIHREHFAVKHPEVPINSMKFELKWIGVGPAPVSKLN
jgi:hypothetical protein